MPLPKYYIRVQAQGVGEKKVIDPVILYIKPINFRYYHLRNVTVNVILCIF